MKRVLSSNSSIAHSLQDCYAHTRSKKRRLTEPLSYDRKKKIWVSATHVFNYLKNDPLIDWLKFNGTRLSSTSISTNSKPVKSGFMEYIMNKGVEFEDKLVNYIHNNKIEVVKVSDEINDESCNKTIELMKKGVPLIHSAPVQNKHNRTRGLIDLLIRSDYISSLVDECPIEEDELDVGCKLHKKFHYLVIDIKFSTLPLRADGRTLLNSGNYPAYKAQTLIYTQAIGHIQGYTPNYSFILGRRWKYTSKKIKYSNYTCLNKLGVIDYSTIDYQYYERTREAIKWIRDVNTDGDNWTLTPPSREELYPNMCVDSGIWNGEKEKIAEQLGEITTIWNCGVGHREMAMDNRVYSWKDSKCTSKRMGINGDRGKIIDKILEVNRESNIKILPKKIKNSDNNWRKRENEVFVDFESICDLFTDFSDLPAQKPIDMIFMIGVEYYENSKLFYKSFICKDKTLDEEKRIMNEFVAFMKARNDPKMWYWYAEKSFWRRAIARHNMRNIFETKWCDMCNLFKSEPIVVKGCFKFGLKDIAKCMRKHGFISSQIESDCASGTSAMINAWKCYTENSNPESCSIMKDIEKYNEFDCKVLWEIIEYLRKNH